MKTKIKVFPTCCLAPVTRTSPNALLSDNTNAAVSQSQMARIGRALQWRRSSRAQPSRLLANPFRYFDSLRFVYLPFIYVFC